MTEISENNRSNVIVLLKQQKYEEALPLLNDLVEKNPSHQEYFIYHLLVLRILILRWSLSHTVTGPVNYFRRAVAGSIRSLASVACVYERLTTIPSVDEIYRSARTSLAKLSTKNLRAAGAYCALLVALLGFYMIAVSNVASVAPSNKLTATGGLQSVVSASEVKVHHPTRTEVAEPDLQGIPVPTESDDQNSLPESVLQASKSLPPKASTGGVAVTGDLREVAKRESKTSGNHVTTAQVNESKPVVVEGQQLKIISNTENSRVATAADKPGENKAVRVVLGEYKARRAIRIRQSPSFAAKTVQELDSGILLNVVEFIGSWAKVELRPEGITGFVRREFLISIPQDNTAGLPGVKESTDVATLARR